MRNTCPTDPVTPELDASLRQLRSKIDTQEMIIHSLKRFLTKANRDLREARRDRDAAIDGWEEESRLCEKAIEQRDYWMQLARSEAERADQCQPLTAGERRWWSIAGILGLIGAGVVLGMQVGGRW